MAKAKGGMRPRIKGGLLSAQGKFSGKKGKKKGY